MNTTQIAINSISHEFTNVAAVPSSYTWSNIGVEQIVSHLSKRVLHDDIVIAPCSVISTPLPTLDNDWSLEQSEHWCLLLQHLGDKQRIHFIGIDDNQ